ncbi:MAG: hypothetical protein WDM87_17340 [Terracidiphilus sp.]
MFPLAIADTGENLVAPAYTVELGDRAVCHRNATFGDTEAVFLSTRLVEDRFGLAFEFFINVAHNFVEVAGVPESFATLVGRKPRHRFAEKPAWTHGRRARRALEPRNGGKTSGTNGIDERAPQRFFRVVILRRSCRLYALARCRLRLPRSARARVPAAGRPRNWPSAYVTWPFLFPSNVGYEFQIHYRRKG